MQKMMMMIKLIQRNLIVIHQKVKSKIISMNLTKFKMIFINKKFIGSIEREVYNYLLQNSEPISSSLISSNLKILIGKSTSDNDFILIKTFDKETINKAKIDKLKFE